MVTHVLCVYLFLYMYPGAHRVRTHRVVDTAPAWPRMWLNTWVQATVLHPVATCVAGVHLDTWMQLSAPRILQNFDGGTHAYSHQSSRILFINIECIMHLCGRIHLHTKIVSVATITFQSSRHHPSQLVRTPWLSVGIVYATAQASESQKQMHGEFSLSC